MRLTAAAALAASFSLLACNSSTPDDPANSSPEEGTGAEVEDSADPTPTDQQPTDGSGAEVADADGSGETAEPVEPEVVDITAADGWGPLSPEAHALFWGSVEDDPPEVLNATRPDLEGRHYLYCDELNLHLFNEWIDNINGGYCGVGSDQAYLFMGMQRPHLVWLTDYDPWIRHLHWAYHAFFRAAEDFETFLSYWDDDAEDRAEQVIRETYEGRDDVDDIVFVYGEARNDIERRFRRLGDIMPDAGIPSFVTDQETYEFVRQMVINERVRPMIANLLDDEALVGIAEVARELDVPVRIFYLSNAEDYWEYPDQFRVNFNTLYFDDQSVILRTDAKKRRNNDYAYCAQPALLFQQWLQQDYVVEIDDVWPRERVRDANHIPVRFLDDEPFDRNAGEEDDDD